MPSALMCTRTQPGAGVSPTVIDVPLVGSVPENVRYPDGVGEATGADAEGDADGDGGPAFCDGAVARPRTLPPISPAATSAATPAATSSRRGRSRRARSVR